MNMTNNDVLELVKKAKKESSKLAHITDKRSLTAQDKFKISLCKLFVQFMNEKKLRAKEMSELTSIPTSRLSEITRYKIKLVTVDKILSYLEILAEHSPKIREHLVMLEQAMELPVMNVKATKLMTKTLKHISIDGIDTDRKFAF